MTCKDFAYVTLVFNGDRYIPGVINLWYSLQESKTQYDFVCIYTNDVPEKSIKFMTGLGIKTRLVEYVRFETKPSLTRKQNERYSAWSNVSYTKWQCLKLDEYQKVLFLDADMVVINNPDDVFKAPTPAGVFESPWTFHNFYKFETPGVVTRQEIKKIIHNRGFIASATCMLLEPCTDCFRSFIEMMENMQPFGFNCMSGFDEQSIAYYYSVYNKGKCVGWHHIGIEYAYLLWKYEEGKEQNELDLDNENNKRGKIKIIDYFGKDKPWELARDAWPDLKYWWDSWDSLIKQHPKAKTLINK